MAKKRNRQRFHWYRSPPSWREVPVLAEALEHELTKPALWYEHDAWQYWLTVSEDGSLARVHYFSLDPWHEKEAS